MAFTWNRDVVVAAAAAGPPAPGQASEDERAKAGQILKDLFNYLSTYAPSHALLMPAFTEMNAAVAAYSARQPGVFDWIQKVLDTIEEQRLLDPGIPQP